MEIVHMFFFYLAIFLVNISLSIMCVTKRLSNMLLMISVEVHSHYMCPAFSNEDDQLHHHLCSWLLLFGFECC